MPKDDQYDYEDNFIDDSEIIEYYAGDRRKAKHSGFFVNSGEIEKVRQEHANATAAACPRLHRDCLSRAVVSMHQTVCCMALSKPAWPQ